MTDHDGSVSDYQKARNTGGSSTTNYFSNNSGAVSVGSNNVHQTVTHGMDFSAVSQFAQPSRRSHVLDGIPEDDHEQLRETAAEIAKPQPNVSKLRQLSDLLWRSLLKAAPSATTTVVTDLAHKAAEEIRHIPT